jgi:hypothetical protein
MPGLSPALPLALGAILSPMSIAGAPFKPVVEPPEGAKYVTAELGPFSPCAIAPGLNGVGYAASNTFDFTGSGISQIAGIRGIEIDNSQNVFSLFLTLPATLQKIRVPKYSVLRCPLQTSSLSFDIETKYLQPVAGASFLNFPVKFFNFEPQCEIIQTYADADVFAPVTSAYDTPFSAAVTIKAAGGTQKLMPPNPFRAGFSVAYSPATWAAGDAAELIWGNILGGAPALAPFAFIKLGSNVWLIVEQLPSPGFPVPKTSLWVNPTFAADNVMYYTDYSF